MDPIEAAVRNLEMASELLRTLESTGVHSGPAHDEAVARKKLLEAQLNDATAAAGKEGFASLVSSLTRQAKRRPKPQAELIVPKAEPFTVLDDETYTPSPERLDPSGPTLLVSFDIRRSYIASFGYYHVRKLPGVAIRVLIDYVMAASRVGEFTFEGIVNEVSSITGVSRVKKALLNGGTSNVRIPVPRFMYPSRIDVVDVGISEDD
jgi:hypothetical protein